jgi:hypothetical protein
MSLVHRGKIRDGAIVLSEPITLPDETDVVVSIEPLESDAQTDTSCIDDASAQLPFIGIWADREDMSDSADWVRKEREAWRQRLARQD